VRLTAWPRGRRVAAVVLLLDTSFLSALAREEESHQAAARLHPRECRPRLCARAPIGVDQFQIVKPSRPHKPSRGKRHTLRKPLRAVAEQRRLKFFALAGSCPDLADVPPHAAKDIARVAKQSFMSRPLRSPLPLSERAIPSHRNPAKFRLHGRGAV
jgi:hypothetical protein